VNCSVKGGMMIYDDHGALKIAHQRLIEKCAALEKRLNGLEERRANCIADHMVTVAGLFAEVADLKKMVLCRTKKIEKLLDQRNCLADEVDALAAELAELKQSAKEA